MEDETTQTSSPGGWQGRLSAFLHVHRGSRASSRKSSRASDASDISELGGPWLNLPLLLLSSAANVAPEELDLGRDFNDVSIKVSGATPDAVTPTAPAPTARRRSIYNFPFFLKHQDAVETPDESASPPVHKRSGSFKAPSSGATSLHPATAEEASAKPKRGSIIRRRASAKVRRSHPHPEAAVSGADVSILVTEASPEAPAPASVTGPPRHHAGEVVHVLVHRESEEYAVEEEAATPAETIYVPERPARPPPPPPPSAPPPAECVITIEPDEMDDETYWNRDRLLDSPPQDS